MIHKLSLLLLIVSCFVCSCRNSDDEPVKASNTLPFIMDMVYDNPGESPTITKYKNPGFLKEAGYNGMVSAWHIQCGLTYDSFETNIIPKNSDERNWILNKQDWIKKKLAVAEKEKMPVFAFTDILVLPTLILEKYKNELIRQQENSSGFSAIHGKLVPDINQPLTQKLIRVQIDEIFSTFPELDGLVIRFGETYLFDTPFHSGGSPVKVGGEEGIDGHVRLLKILREEICVKRNKKLFYRTWDFGFFHTNPEVFLKITDQVEPHDNLFFSIKYTKGDFHRLLPFNPTLGIGKHKYIVEYQCQPEYYGKGAHPAFVFDGLINGFKEYDQVMNPGDKQGLKDLRGDPNFAGLWTWSRGGGWRGPYITNELWCDVNALSAVEWAKDTLLSASEALNKAALKLGVRENSLADFNELLALSAMGLVRGHCSLIDIPEAHFNVWWMRDHFMEGNQKLKPFFNYVIKNDKVEEVFAEKKESVSIWKRMEELAKTIKINDKADEDYLMVSVTYGRYKYEIIEKAFTIMLLGYMGDQDGNYEKERIRTAISEYDKLWEEWKQFIMEHPSSATIYYPDAFKIGKNGVSGDKSRGLAATVDKYRGL